MGELILSVQANVFTRIHSISILAEPKTLETDKLMDSSSLHQVGKAAC